MAPPSSRKQSIAESVDKHMDKNTIILIVNLLILVVLMSLLYVVASSALGPQYAQNLPPTNYHKDEH